jgi:structural maintenance of chromosome 1
MPKAPRKKSAKKSPAKSNQNSKSISPSKDISSENSYQSDSETQNDSPSLKLHKLILENFKSFQGRNEIGYFQDFSVVLGPNGSGKSNIIDALSFVFGLNAQQMRTRNLKELIYNPHSSSSKNKAQNCSVEIIFKKNLKNQSQKLKTQSLDEISFRRTVNASGSSSFYFNDKKLTQEDYIQKLMDFSIPVNSMYFILGQGGVDSLFSSKRNKIEQIIEVLSGSYKYKERYDELVKNLEEKNNELNSLSSQINSIKLDKNKIKAQLENKGLYKENINKIQTLMKKIYLYQFAEQDSIKSLCEENLEGLKDEIIKVENEKKNEINSMKENEKELGNNKKNVENIMNEEMALQKELDQKKNKIKITEEEIKKCETDIFNNISVSNQLKEDLKKKESKKKSLLQEQTEISKDIKEIKKILNTNIDESSSKLTKEQITEFKSLSLSLQSSISSNISQLNSLELSSQNLISQKSLLEKTLSQSEIEKNSAENIANVNEQEIDKMKENLEKKDNKIKEMKKNFEKCEKKKEELTEKNLKIVSELENKVTELSNFKVENNESRRRKKIGEFMSKNDKVYGFLFELIKPLQKKFELSIKVSLLRYLDYLVVENYETSVKVSEFLQNNEINCDVLVLENIPKVKEVDQTKRLKVGSEGNFIYDLIESKKKSVENAIKFFLKDLILCKPENIPVLRSRGFRKFITEDGTVYRRNYISGGNYKNLERYNFIYKTKEESDKIIEQLKKDIDDLTEELKEVMVDQEKNEEELKQNKKFVDEEKECELIKNELNNKEITFRKQKDSLKDKEKAIKKLEKNIAEVNNELESINSEKSDLTISINNIKKQYFRNFMQKYNLSSLDDFEQFTIEKMNSLSQELKVKEVKILDIERKLKLMEDSEKKISEIEEEIEKIQSKKSEKETQKKKLEKEFTKSNNYLSEFKATNESKLAEIKNIQENIKKGNENIMKLDERIRKLLKGQVEQKHKIEVAMNNKSQLMKDIVTDHNKLIKELDQNFQEYALIFQLDFDINQYLLKNDLNETSNISDIVIDYSDIEKKNKIEELTPEKIQQIIAHKKEKLDNYLKEIQKYVMLYITFDKEEEKELEDKENKLNNEKKDLKKKIETLVNEQEDLKKSLAEIKEKRTKKFLEFFNKLKENLKELYTKLTVKDNNPGGNAYLYCSNEDEPYKGTVVYLPTPPGKRVIYDIEQLSGGEKTIAIVSLLSSLQNITGCPLLILDEVDAYLDQKHELMLEKLFSEKKKEYQIVIVTHKLNIYRNAESLLGTYFSKNLDSSVPISFDNK